MSSVSDLLHQAAATPSRPLNMADISRRAQSRRWRRVVVWVTSLVAVAGLAVPLEQLVLAPGHTGPSVGDVSRSGGGRSSHSADKSAANAFTASGGPGSGVQGRSGTAIGVNGTDRGAATSESRALARHGRIAFVSVASGSQGIYTMNADGTDRRRLTTAMADGGPAWSADATHIAFARRNPADSGIYVMNADGSGLRHVITLNGMGVSHPSWSPDGKRIAFMTDDTGQTYNQQRQGIWIVNADGTNAQEVVYGRVNSPGFGGYGVYDPAWSPDGKYIAFDSFPGSTDVKELFVFSLDRNDERDLGTGGSPAWSPDGKRIAVIDGHILSKPQSLVVMNAADGSGRRTLATSQDFYGHPSFAPDGKTIVFDRDPDGHLTSCWFDRPDDTKCATGPLPSAIWTIGSDGSHLRQLSAPGDNDQDANLGVRR